MHLNNLDALFISMEQLITDSFNKDVKVRKDTQ